MLQHPAKNCTLAISNNASDVAVRGSLDHLLNGKWFPLAFFSKKLSKAEQKYAVFDRKLLAMYLAVKQFWHYVEGRNFTLFSDQKPLVGAMTNTIDRSPLQTRHLSFIAEFSADVQHISGKTKNVVADALSRSHPVFAILFPDMDYKQLGIDQCESEEIKTSKASTSLQLKDVSSDDYTVLCDMSTGVPRPVIPQNWTRPVFELCHNLSHAGF